jgi:hypothetical protein
MDRTVLLLLSSVSIYLLRLTRMKNFFLKVKAIYNKYIQAIATQIHLIVSCSSLIQGGQGIPSGHGSQSG